MGLLDLFTGAASKKAAKQNAAAIQVGQTNSLNALGGARDNALGLLGTGTGAPGSSGGNALSALGSGFDQARGDITAGYDGAQPALSKLGSQYAPMVAGGQKSFDSFLDASGANGAEGSARATENFRAAPGYTYQRDEALDSVMRLAAARGDLSGGNTTKDILRTATGLADQSWNSYLGNLKTGSDFYTTGLAGQGQGLTAQAGASIGRGTALGALGVGQGQSTANIYGTGAGIQGLYGTNASNVYTNATNQQIGNNNNLAASQNAAGANILGAILGGAQLATGNFGAAAGKAAGGGGGANVSPYAGNPFLSGLGNMFG